MHRSADDIFNDALELPPEERDAFIEEACRRYDVDPGKIRELLDIACRCPGLMRPPETPPAGIGGYSVIGELGRGGMGIVYLARDPHLSREVAIKVLSPSISADGDRLQRLQREAQLLAGVKHPNVATVHEFLPEEAAVVLEHIEGETLAERIRRGPLPWKEARAVCLQVAQACEAAHRHHVIHRDLKPANIMIERGGRVKVVDFGIARALEPLGSQAAAFTKETPGTAPGAEPQSKATVCPSAFAGTPGYRSPEQTAGQPADQRSDIWALGCILYECLSGQRPFEEAPTGEGWRLVDRRSRFGLPAHVPRRLRRLIERCLRMDPSRRPSSMATVAEALARERRVPVWSVALAAMSIVIAAVALWPRSGDTTRVETVSRRDLRGIDHRGRVVWTQRMPDEIIANRLRPVATQRQPDPFATIPFASDRAGVLVSTHRELAPGRLWLLSESSGDTIWSREIRWRRPVNESQGPPDACWQAPIHWPDSDGGTAVLVGMSAGIWYPFAVQVLDLDGQTLATYYHPGHLWYGGQFDLDGDGRSSLLLYGQNSSARFDRRIVAQEEGFHCGCAILLDGFPPESQAFPYAPDSLGRDWPGLPAAREEAYLLIPPSKAGMDGTVNDVTFTPRPDGFSLQVRSLDGRHYMTDADLRPLACWNATGGTADSLQRAGIDFGPVLYIRRGEEEVLRLPLEDSRPPLPGGPSSGPAAPRARGSAAARKSISR